MGRKTSGLLVAVLVSIAFICPSFAQANPLYIAMLTMPPTPSFPMHGHVPVRPVHHGVSGHHGRTKNLPAAHTTRRAANGKRSVSRHTNRAGSRRRRTTHQFRALSRSRKKSVKSAKPIHKGRTYMYEAPSFNQSPFGPEMSGTMHHAFNTGRASSYDPLNLVRAGVFSYCPLHGGIFWRKEAVKYIVVHSTETGRPAEAQRVVRSWNNMGLVHPGAQFVVDRDGTIYMTLDPDMGCPHVDVSRALWGVNNDNAIGIEIDHTGDQTYTTQQKEAVLRLVSYLQDRYRVSNDHVVTHRFVQPSDRTDPVNFDWDGFLSCKNNFRSLCTACKIDQAEQSLQAWANQTALPWSKKIPAFLSSMLHRRS